MSYSYQFLTYPIYRSVLRALIPHGPGCYIDINPQHPSAHSLTNPLYEMDWLGIHLEPEPQYLAYLQKVRATDINLGVTIKTSLKGDGLSSLLSPYCLASLQLLRVNRLGSCGAELMQWDWTNFPQRPWIMVIENDQQFLNFFPSARSLLADDFIQQHYQIVLKDEICTVLVSRDRPDLIKQVADIEHAHLNLPKVSIWKKRSATSISTLHQPVLSRWQLLKNLLQKVKTVIADGRLVPVAKQRAKKWLKPMLAKFLHVQWIRKVAYFLMDRVSWVHHLAVMMKEGSSHNKPLVVQPTLASQYENNLCSQQVQSLMGQLQRSIEDI